MISGYGTIGANLAFTMVSIPLAIHYLGKNEFGLWVLAAQINGFLCLIDLGMNAAMSRFLADYKDNVDGGDYGQHLVTGALVFAIQGLFIASIGFGFSWFAPSLFAIPAELSGIFSNLLILLAGISGFSVALRSLGAPLWAFQRIDVVNNCATLGLILSLAFLWLALESGLGAMSIVVSQFPGAILAPLVFFVICRRNGYYPSKNHWGKPNIRVFKRVFLFGKDSLFVNIGSQLITASQVMVVSRCIGLEAAATFAVSTKIYTMAMMLLNNPLSSAAPVLTEIYVQKNLNRFFKRYWDLVFLTLAVSTLFATGIAAGNSSFVSLWTHGRISWNWQGDCILAVLIVLRNLNGCFIGLFGLTKDWRPVRYILPLEGIVFIPIGIHLAQTFGIIGVLWASLITHLLVTTILSTGAVTRFLGLPEGIFKSVAVSLLLLAISSAFGWFGDSRSIPPITMMFATVGLCLLSFFLASMEILPEHLRNEISIRKKRFMIF